jgi:hypothetical protein
MHFNSEGVWCNRTAPRWPLSVQGWHASWRQEKRIGVKSCQRNLLFSSGQESFWAWLTEFTNLVSCWVSWPLMEWKRASELFIVCTHLDLVTVEHASLADKCRETNHAAFRLVPVYRYGLFGKHTLLRLPPKRYSHCYKTSKNSWPKTDFIRRRVTCHVRGPKACSFRGIPSLLSNFAGSPTRAPLRGQ